MTFDDFLMLFMILTLLQDVYDFVYFQDYMILIIFDNVDYFDDCDDVLMISDAFYGFDDFDAC